MRSLLLITLLMHALSGAAQSLGEWDDPPASWRERLWFGGGINLGFGTVTAVQLDPVVGYKADKNGRYSIGVGGSYWHYRDNRFSPPYTITGKGYRVFNRYRVFPPIFVHAEFLHLNVPAWSVRDRVYREIWVPHLLLGGGYMQRVSGRSSVYIQVLYEVLQDPNSVYRGLGPVLGGGVGIGF